MSQIEAVCVVHELHPDEHNGFGQTAIDKRPVAGRVVVRSMGLDGDRQMDADNHGGPDKAVYAYAREDVAFWSSRLGRDIAPGQFGENLLTSDLDVTGALVGEQWRIGAAFLEVTQPRIPCATFQSWLGEARWVRRFTEHGAPGAYLRVLEEGEIAAGDDVEVVHRPPHGISIGRCFVRFDPAAGRALLDAGASGEIELADSLRVYAERAAARM